MWVCAEDGLFGIRGFANYQRCHYSQLESRQHRQQPNIAKQSLLE
jgi:hypothetical protein